MQQVPHLLWWHLQCPTVAGQLEPTKAWHFQTRWVPWAMLCACLPPLPAECLAANNAGWSSRCFCHTTPCKPCSVGTLHPQSCRGCHTSALTLACSSWYFFFISSFCLIQVVVWYLYFTDVYKHYSSQCHKHIICIYTHIFIMTRACRTVCISKQWYYQKLAISF